MPAFRRYTAGDDYIAYGEGWALYAETLGLRLGLFGDPLSYYVWTTPCSVRPGSWSTPASTRSGGPRTVP